MTTQDTSNSEQPAGQMLTTEEVAQRTGMTVAWVLKRRIVGGGPPFVKFGAAVRYPADQLDAWVQERTYTQIGRKAPRAGQFGSAQQATA